MAKKPSIITLPPFIMATVALVALGLMAAIWIKGEIASFERESAAARDSHIAERKKFLRTAVSEVVSFVNFNRQNVEQRVRDTIEQRVEEAHAVALHLLTKYKGSKSKEELDSLIREALRPIRFNDQRGYFFAFDLKGVEQLFADRPELEGKNMMKVRGAKGEAVVPDMLKIIGEKGGGFYRYYWTKPGESKDSFFEKIAFVKLIEPMGWVVGTGEYIVDVERDIKKEVLHRLSAMTIMGKEYVFAGQWDGLALAGPAKGRNMFEVTDPNGVKIVQELIRAAKNGGGFVEYVTPQLDDLQPIRKISYAAGIPDWQWYLGAGAPMDEIDSQIALARAEFEDRFYRRLAAVLALVFTGSAAVFITARWTSYKSRVAFDAFLRFFQTPQPDSAAIDKDKLAFREFTAIADAASHMVELQTQDMRSAKEEADLANKAKTNFLANMSHELRTPLNAIIGFSSTMQEKIFGPLGHEKYEEYVHHVQESGEHLLELINDILDLSKIESDSFELDEHLIALSDLVQASERMIRPRAEKGSIELVNNVGPNLPLLYGDPRRVKQILVNLLSNAVKFTQRGGHVEVNARLTSENCLQLIVSDTGVGMDERELETALAPFGQVDSLLARKKEGTGLGLPLTNVLIKLHQGTMSIDSAKGQGTEVVVTFPSVRTEGASYLGADI